MKTTKELTIIAHYKEEGRTLQEILNEIIRVIIETSR